MAVDSMAVAAAVDFTVGVDLAVVAVASTAAVDLLAGEDPTVAAAVTDRLRLQPK